MANMFGYGNKVAAKFISVRREVRDVNLVVVEVPPVEAEKRADLWY